MNTNKFDIYVNQTGYLPNAEKTAYMAFSAESFSVCDSSGKTVLTGKTKQFGFDKLSGDTVFTADFSSLDKSGIYYISAEGKRSAVFEISDDVYRKNAEMLLHAFYYLRCGCELEGEFAGEFVHKKCHTAPAAEWYDHSVTKDVCGGWHDAGDYGRYVTAGAVALQHMLIGCRLFPEQFYSLKSNIPSCGKLPDILAECKVELDWIMKMQREDGGVYHKATTAHHAPFIMPEDDLAQMYLLPVSSMAAADTAAVLALASGIYREFDREYADRLLKAAEKSYEWLENNPDFLGFDNPEGCGTGVYGERDDKDNRFWAAAELFSVTGEEKYHCDLMKLIDEDFPKTALGFGEVGGMGALAYILSDGGDENVKARLKRSFSEKAAELKKLSDSCGYGTAMTERAFCWGSNMNVLKNAMLFIIAAEICGERKYIPYAQKELDYIYGANALGISYVTGAGEYSVRYPHYRPADADNIDSCHEGFVSGGANGRPCDEKAIKLIPEGTFPMKCFVDEVECYSLNEITIYWNSPAVFSAGYFGS